MPASTRSKKSASNTNTVIATSKAKAAKVSKKTVIKPKVAVDLKKIIQKANPKIVQARKAINAQVLHRAVTSQLKKLGNRPIALVAKTVVKKGLSLKPKSAGISKKKPITHKEAMKPLIHEMLKVSGAKPSEIKLRRQVANSKVTVNAEIVKKAMLAQIKVRGVKPPKINVKSLQTKSIATSSKSLKATSPMKKSPRTPKSPMAKNAVGPKKGTQSKATSPLSKSAKK